MPTLTWTQDARNAVESYRLARWIANPERFCTMLTAQAEVEARYWNADTGIVDRDCVLLAVGTLFTDNYDH